MLLLTWLLYPLVLAALCLGCGLALRRVAGDALPRHLLLPAGVAVVVVVAVLMTFLAATAPFAAAALVVLAVGGFVVAGRRGLAALRPRRTWLWPAVAAGLPFAAIAAPVVLTGEPGFTGYTRILDIAFQMEIAAHLVDDGRSIPAVTDSSFTTLIDRTLGSGYPGGTQAALGSTAAVAGVDVIWAWQPFLAWLGAMLGLSLYALLGRAIPWAPGRAVAAGVAAQPTILYSYALSSGVKELGAALFFALAAALLLTARGHAGASIRRGLPIVVAVAAGFGTFTLGIVPWVAVLLLVAMVPSVVGRRTQSPGRGGTRAGLALTAIALIITVPVILGLGDVLPQVLEGGPADLGNLAAPVPAWAVLGPWLISDHRHPLDVVGAELPTAIAAGFVALLAAAGFARAVARRDVVLSAAGVAAAVALTSVLVAGSSWVELKAVAVSAPIAVALAFAGAAALGRAHRRPWAPLAAGAVIAGTVVAGNALVYQGTTLAPYDRLSELQGISDRLDTAGRTLHPAFDEYAGYLLREERAVTPADAPDSDEGLRADAPPGPVFSRDLDHLRLDFITRFDVLVLRRDPTHSRPPSDFRLVERTEHYAVWRRDRDAPRVVHHLPVATGEHRPTAAQCARLGRAVATAGAGASLASAPAPEVARFLIPASALPSDWPIGEEDRLARGPARAQFAVRVARDDEYRVWLRGSFGRQVEVWVAGRRVGDLRWAQNYPDQYEPVGTVRLPAGTHEARVVRGGGSLLPGTGNDVASEGGTTRIGPLALQPVDGPREAVYWPASRAMELCRGSRPLDWLEVVRARRP